MSPLGDFWRLQLTRITFVTAPNGGVWIVIHYTLGLETILELPKFNSDM